MAEAEWRVQYKGDPNPVLTWYDNTGQPILENSEKYQVNTTNAQSTLKIRRLSMDDSGLYTLRAQNGVTNASQEFELIVRGES